MAQENITVDAPKAVGSEGKEIWGIELWTKLYAGEKDAWSVPIINTAISVELYQKFTGGRKNLDVFLPMCGRSPDIIWLASQGHHVTGVEWVESSIEKFFKENNLEYEVKIGVEVGIGKGALYCAKTVPIRIYCCDLFTVTSEAINKFDLILDVGSATSVDKLHRKDYGVIIRSLLKPKGSILISTFRYDQTLRNKPPFSIHPEEVEILFGNDFDIVEVQSEGTERFKQFYTAGEILFDVSKLPMFEWNIHLLAAKN